MTKLTRFLPWRKTVQRSQDTRQEDHYAHLYLGNLYMSLGDTAQAEAEYSRAYALIPSEEVRRQLALIRKRRTEQSQSANRPFTARRAA
jgi:tetratricopeptide (TPR) repeat protein